MPQVEQSTAIPRVQQSHQKDLGGEQGTPGILQRAPKLRSAQSLGDTGLGMVSRGFRGAQHQLDLIHRTEEGAQGSCRINGAEDQVQRHLIGGIADLVDQSKVDDLGGVFQPKQFCGLSQV